MAIIKTKGLEFGYVTRGEGIKTTEVDHAIDDMGPQIEAGGFVAIFGHSDSDESTLAETLSGILLPNGDTVLISGMNTAGDAKFLDIRREVGMVFQNLDNQTATNLVEDDVNPSPESPGVPTEEIWQKVDVTLKTVDMTAFRLKPPNHLSDGQKRHAAIAGVVAIHPRCIVPDEPTVVLDLNGRKEVIRTTTEFNRNEGITVVLVTHYMEEVIRADHLVVVDDGKVIMDRAPQEVFARVGELGHLRLDVSQATELVYELKQRGVSLPDSVLTMEGLAEAILPLWKKN